MFKSKFVYRIILLSVLIVLIASLTQECYCGSASTYSVYLKQINEVIIPSQPTDIYVREDTAYITSSYGMLSAVNLSRPYETLTVSYFDNIPGVIAIAFNGYYAYAACNDGKIKIYDFSSDERPLKNTLETHGNINKIAVSDGLLYCTLKDLGLGVYDITNPTYPILKGNQIISGTPTGLFVKNRKAYISTSNAYFSIINTSDLSKLPVIGTYNFGNVFYDVYVADNFAYLPQGATGVQVLNVETLSKPVWVTNIFSRKFSKQVYVSGYYTWVNDDNTIQAFYNRDPTNQLYAGSFDNKGIPINRIYVADGKYIYVVTGDGRLKILKIEYNY
jgi:hypothetical protein